jgi:hypothetical protein
MSREDPELRIVGGGRSTDQELAALMSALVVVTRRETVDPTQPSRWNDRGAGLRRPLPRGRGWAWADRG